MSLVRKKPRLSRITSSVSSSKVDSADFTFFFRTIFSSRSRIAASVLIFKLDSTDFTLMFRGLISRCRRTKSSDVTSERKPADFSLFFRISICSFFLCNQSSVYSIFLAENQYYTRYPPVWLKLSRGTTMKTRWKGDSKFLVFVPIYIFIYGIDFNPEFKNRN